MKLSLDLASGKEIVGDVDEAHEESGRRLLSRLAVQAAALPDALHIVDVEWAVLRLRAEGQSILVEEPDYAGEATQFVPSLDATCLIFELQQELLRKLNVQEQPIGALQYSRVSAAALGAVSAAGHRLQEDEKPFTGWQINSTSGTQEDFGLYMTRELAALRLEWMVAMVLPTGWSFRYVGKTLLECTSPEGKKFVTNLSVDF